MKHIIFKLLLFNSGMVLGSQNLEFILTSLDTIKSNKLIEINENNIVVDFEFSSYIININDVSSINILSLNTIKTSNKDKLFNSIIGSTLGYISGNLVGNLLLWWISYDELGSLKLFKFNSNGLNQGENLIKNNSIKLMTNLGAYAGYRYNFKTSLNREKYTLDNMSIGEKKNKIEVIFKLNSKKNDLIKRYLNKLKNGVRLK